MLKAVQGGGQDFEDFAHLLTLVKKCNFLSHSLAEIPEKFLLLMMQKMCQKVLRRLHLLCCFNISHSHLVYSTLSPTLAPYLQIFHA